MCEVTRGQNILSPAKGKKYFLLRAAVDVVKYQGGRWEGAVKVSEDTIVDNFFWKLNKVVLSIDSNMMNIKSRWIDFFLNAEEKSAVD